MPRKKTEDIFSLGLSDSLDIDKLLVQKSIPLLSLWQSKFTLQEFKILDAYLALIDSHKPNQRTVTFTKGKFEQLLEVDKINQKDLEERIRHLMSHVVKVNDPTVRRGFTIITLFSSVNAEQDEKTGLWKIKLTCTAQAMKYIFNVENLGYLRYKLRCITSLQSRYAYLMFLYLEHNRYKKQWRISVEELQEMLGCADEPTYQEFKRFNDRLLKRVHAELIEKTDCKYSYKPIRIGRAVFYIEFTIDDLPETIETIDSDLKALAPMHLTQPQLAEIKLLIKDIPDKDSYLLLKFAELNRRNEVREIKNKFAYLRKMIKSNVEEKEQKQEQHEQQRKTASYDLKAYEEMFNSPEYQEYLFRGKENKP